ncbi:unnamed protein product [Penicillium roqueforti FM164]|uniref:Genomic scaffold, ProqFM164S01 n=1 Tax=Penicillium roqueforti (strain FM164) TaxID=1365484 RepID=W6PRX4_PENRF|nr:unnamed protein product [Penicillium roqueforti FM164]
MRGGCTVDCGLHSPASGASACTISPLFGVQMIQANTCKVHLKETVKFRPTKPFTGHRPGLPSRICHC